MIALSLYVDDLHLTCRPSNTVVYVQLGPHGEVITGIDPVISAAFAVATAIGFGCLIRSGFI
jgi:hypothetical protein